MTERMGLAAVGRQNRQRAALARRAELRPAARRLAAVAVGFAGGWAVVYGALMPFGLGFVLGFAEDCFAPCAAGAALGVLLHGFGALSLRSVCMLCALGAAVAARWMGARTLTPAALAGCGTLVGVALCFAFGGGGAELVFYSAADALLAAAMGFCLRQFAPEKPGAGMLLVGAAAAAALGSIQLWQLLPGVIVCAALELYLCSKGQAKAALAACAVLGAQQDLAVAAHPGFIQQIAGGGQGSQCSLREVRQPRKGRAGVGQPHQSTRAGAWLSERGRPYLSSASRYGSGSNSSTVCTPLVVHLPVSSISAPHMAGTPVV